jgi:RND family efflux transporter MFP subunit
MNTLRWLFVAAVCTTPWFAGAAPIGEFDCMIEPAQTIEIRSPVVGLLQQVPVRRGAVIRRGDVLAVLESSVERSASDIAKFRAEAQGAIISAQSKLAGAQAKAKRFQQLYEDEFVSAQARDDAENERKLAEAELQVARDNAGQARLEHQQSLDQLNRRTLRSPVDGVVADQYLFPGALVDTGEGKKPILKVAQTSVLTVTAMVPFRYFQQVKASDDVVVTPEQPFSQPRQAKVKAVDRLIESTSGTFGVVAELNNANQVLPSGIRCKMTIGR